MGSKLLLGLGLLFLLLFNQLLYTPKKGVRSNDLLFANPTLFRFLSGIAHNVLADGLWLLRSTVSEAHYKDSFKVDKEALYLASRTVATMDPYFYEANNYGITYLATIGKDLEKAESLIHLARFFDKENFNLYFLDVLFLVTYAKDYDKAIDFAYVKRLVEKMMAMPEGKKVFERMRVSAWLAYFKHFADDELLRIKQKRQDLLWLYKKTEDPKRKLEIKKKLDKLPK